MANRLGTNDPIYDLSRIGGGLNPLPGSPPDSSLEATAVGYGSDTNTLTGDVANFYYNDTTKLLSVKINEVWVQETKYIVVDADGRGDYTTLQAALTAIAAAGADAETWTVIYRTPTTENISFAPGSGKPDLAVHIWALGGATLTGRVDGDVYGKLHLHNMAISYNSNDNSKTVTSANGNSLYLYGCTISRTHLTAPENVVIGPAGGTVYLYDCSVFQEVNSNYSVFYGAGEIYAYNCKIDALGGRGIAEANSGAAYYFYHCVLTGSGGNLFNTAGGGNVYVARCQFDTTVGGTYTILDGDVPPPDASSITPAMLANASAQYKYLVSGATPFAYAESAGNLNIASGKTLTVSNSITLTGTDGGTTALAVTSGKTLTLTSTDDRNLTVPESLTAAGRDVDNAFTADMFFSGAGSGLPYGSITISDNVTATTISSASTYVQVNFDTNGLSNLTTPDHTNDHITVVKTGVYRVEAHGDCHDGTVNNNYEIAVCKNNGATVLNGGVRTHVFFDFATSEPQFAMGDYVSLTANDTLELWVKNNTAGNDITFAFVSLSLEMVGG